MGIKMRVAKANIYIVRDNLDFPKYFDSNLRSYITMGFRVNMGDLMCFLQLWDTLL